MMLWRGVELILHIGQIGDKFIEILATSATLGIVAQPTKKEEEATKQR